MPTHRTEDSRFVRDTEFAKTSSMGFIFAALAISMSDFTLPIETPIFKNMRYVYIIYKIFYK